MFWGRLYLCDPVCCDRWLLETSTWGAGRVVTYADEQVARRALLTEYAVWKETR